MVLCVVLCGCVCCVRCKSVVLCLSYECLCLVCVSVCVWCGVSAAGPRESKARKSNNDALSRHWLVTVLCVLLACARMDGAAENSNS